MKRLFFLLLLANLIFFAWMQWGGALTGDNINLRGQPAVNAEKLKLLNAPVATPSPAPPPSAVAVMQTLPPAPTVSAPSSVPLARLPGDSTCLEWGEFSGVDRARAQESLAPLNLGASLSQRHVEYSSGYWAYIPPAKTRAEVDKKIAVLKARGVKDMYVVQEPGKWHNAISLGVFKTSDAAYKFVRTLHAKGIKTPAVGERMSKLKFTIFMLREPDGKVLEKLTALRNDFTGSELRSVACK